MKDSSWSVFDPYKMRSSGYPGSMMDNGIREHLMGLVMAKSTGDMNILQLIGGKSAGFTYS